MPLSTIGDDFAAKILIETAKAGGKAIDLQSFTLISGTTLLLINLIFTVGVYSFSLFTAYKILRENNHNSKNKGILELIMVILVAIIFAPFMQLFIINMYQFAFHIDAASLIKTALTWDYETIIASPNLIKAPWMKGFAVFHDILASITPFILVGGLMASNIVALFYVHQYVDFGFLSPDSNPNQSPSIMSRVVSVVIMLLIFAMITTSYHSLIDRVYFSDGSLDFISFNLENINNLHEITTNIVAKSLRMGQNL